MFRPILLFMLRGQETQSWTTVEALKNLLPKPLRGWLRSRRQQLRLKWRMVNRVKDFSKLRRVKPYRPSLGVFHGQCIDRYYIEDFLTLHMDDVKGHVLDFSDDTYARKFGGGKTTKVDVLHLSPDNPHATIVADLAGGEKIPSDTFDCILCTQVLHCIYEVDAAVRTLYRVLKPGGVVLVTGPGIQKIDSEDIRNEEEYWRFTSLSLRRLFESVFPENHVEVKAYGNPLTAIAFLHGLAVEDLRRKDLDSSDPDYEVSIALRAVKPRTHPAL